MIFLKSIVKKYFTHFTFFYRRLRYRIFISLGLSILVGTLDGFGLAMFLPLLKMAEGNESASTEGMGKMGFLLDGMEMLGIPFILSSILIVMLVFFLLKAGAKFVEQYYSLITRLYFSRNMRFNNIDSLVSYKYKAFVNADVGHLQNSFSGEVGKVLSAYSSYFSVIRSAVMVMVYVVLAFISNPQFAVLVTIGGWLSNLVYRRIYSKTKERSKQIVRRSSDFQGLLIQIVAFFKYFKATGLIKNYGKKLKSNIDDMQAIGLKMGWYNIILSTTKEPLVISVVLGVILFQTEVIGQSFGAIILTLLFFYRSLTFLMALQVEWNGFLNRSGSLENMQHLMQDLKLNRDSYGSQKLYHFNHTLVLKNATFYYEEETPVLKNINLQIGKNEAIAFVGESGSGKTTLINILAGLLPLDSGSYQIDDNDSKGINIPFFQKRIGYITQEPVIFSDNIFNNVTFWDKPTEENIDKFWKALEKAAIADFVNELPKRENTPLGNNGILVSGGQKQRISIARELYKDIDILIMDEATSALDSETELAIQENIDALKGEYTLLIVAHRLATIKNVDRVILLNKGNIVGDGSFEELKRDSNVFEKMVNLQTV